MTCREALDFLMAYLDGELPAEQQSRFDEHLAVCPQCVEYLNSYRQTVQLAQGTRVPEAALPPVPEDLMRAILASRPRE